MGFNGVGLALGGVRLSLGAQAGGRSPHPRHHQRGLNNIYEYYELPVLSGVQCYLDYPGDKIFVRKGRGLKAMYRIRIRSRFKSLPGFGSVFDIKILKQKVILSF